MLCRHRNPLLCAPGLLAIAVLCACKPEPSQPDPPSANSETSEPSPASSPRRPPQTHVEVLMAGKPPHSALALHPAAGADTRPLSLTATRYGPDGETRRNLHGTLHNTTTVGGTFEHTLRLDDPEDSAPPVVRIRADAWGPTQEAAATSSDPGFDVVLRALMVPVPQDALGEGAIYRVDTPWTETQGATRPILRTTAEVIEVYADGYLLKTDSLLHHPIALPSLEEGKAPAGPPPGTASSSDVIITTRQWRHFDRFLPAKAYGQFRFTDRSGSPTTTLTVDWSLDGAAPEPEAP